MTPPLSLSSHSTILDVPKHDWDELADDNYLLRHGYLRAVEESGLPDMKMRYFRWVRDGRLIAIAAGAVWEMDLLDYVQHKLLRPILRVATVVPGLVRWKVLTIGPPSGVGPTVAVRDDVEPAEAAGMINLLWQQTRKRERIKSIFVRDFFEQRHPIESALLQSGFSRIMYTPMAMLPLRWKSLDELVADLRNMYRTNLHRTQKLFAKSGIRTEVSARPLAPWPDYATLFQNVFDRNQGSRKPIGPDYFRMLDTYFSDHTVWIQYFLRKELVAFTQNTFFGSVLYNRFVGMDYPVTRKWQLYFHTYLDTIELAMRSGAKAVSFGLTTYGPKSAVGCSIVPRRAFVCDRRPLLGRAFVASVKQANQPAVPKLRRALRERSHQQLWDGTCCYWDEMK